MRELLTEGNIDTTFVPERIIRESNESCIRTADSYNLPFRITEAQLEKMFIEKVAESQNKYFSSLDDAFKLWFRNIVYAKEMDAVFGKEGRNYPGEENRRTVLSDGSVKLVCPMDNCTTETFKLKRHLERQHSHLTDSQKLFALSAARKIYRNTKLEGECEDSEAKKKKNSYSNTVLVNRKFNYKECTICSKLCMNIAQHINGVHKISRNDPSYIEYVQNSRTIPKCYTKEVQGKRVKLTSDELRDAEIEHASEVESQQRTLDELKIYRDKMKELRRILNESTGEKKRDVEHELKKTEEQYRNIRFKEMRNLTTNVQKWSSSFRQYLEQREYHNPKRGTRMAIDVMIPFEKVRGVPLKYEDLVSGPTIRAILQQFKQVDSITATSKLKYIQMFNMLLRYLICDFTSPERKNSESPVEVLARGVVMKDIDHEVDGFRALLQKKKGHDLIETKRKAEKKLISGEELEDLLKDKFPLFWKCFTNQAMNLTGTPPIKLYKSGTG